MERQQSGPPEGIDPHVFEVLGRESRPASPCSVDAFAVFSEASGSATVFAGGLGDLVAWLGGDTRPVISEIPVMDAPWRVPVVRRALADAGWAPTRTLQTTRDGLPLFITRVHPTRSVTWERDGLYYQLRLLRVGAWRHTSPRRLGAALAVGAAAAQPAVLLLLWAFFTASSAIPTSGHFGLLARVAFIVAGVVVALFGGVRAARMAVRGVDWLMGRRQSGPPAGIDRYPASGDAAEQRPVPGLFSPAGFFGVSCAATIAGSLTFTVSLAVAAVTPVSSWLGLALSSAGAVVTAAVVEMWVRSRRAAEQAAADAGRQTPGAGQS